MSSATTDSSRRSHQASAQCQAALARGNSGGPGNPFGRRLAESCANACCDSATEENIERLANMLMEKAFAGDMAAAKLLLLYWIGKPKEVVEPDRVDVEEWELAHEHVVRPDVAQETFASMPITVGIAALAGLGGGPGEGVCRSDAPSGKLSARRGRGADGGRASRRSRDDPGNAARPRASGGAPGGFGWWFCAHAGRMSGAAQRERRRRPFAVTNR